jgi:GNAT superfamily N-acetyltransferase
MNANEPTKRPDNWCSVRRATIEDRGIVETLVKVCGKHVSDYHSIRDLKEFYKKGHVWLAYAPAPSAFALARPLIREQVISLYEIGVIPALRGQGIATTIMKTIDAEYPDRIWRLVVNDDNVEARIAYERLGLKAYGYDFTRGGRPIVRMEGKLR